MSAFKVDKLSEAMSKKYGTIWLRYRVASCPFIAYHILTLKMEAVLSSQWIYTKRNKNIMFLDIIHRPVLFRNITFRRLDSVLTETQSCLRNVVFLNKKTGWWIISRNITFVLMYHRHEILDLINTRLFSVKFERTRLHQNQHGKNIYQHLPIHIMTEPFR
jgi:hypothetical protein